MTVYELIRELTDNFDPDDSVVFKLGNIEVSECDFERKTYCSIQSEAHVIVGGS